mgnify:CR=1 FL=1
MGLAREYQSISIRLVIYILWNFALSSDSHIIVQFVEIYFYGL